MFTCMAKACPSAFCFYDVASARKVPAISKFLKLFRLCAFLLPGRGYCIMYNKHTGQEYGVVYCRGPERRSAGCCLRTRNVSARSFARQDSPFRMISAVKRTVPYARGYCLTPPWTPRAPSCHIWPSEVSPTSPYFTAYSARPASACAFLCARTAV